MWARRAAWAALIGFVAVAVVLHQAAANWFVPAVNEAVLRCALPLERVYTAPALSRSDPLA
jgi:hypothetical protein